MCPLSLESEGLGPLQLSSPCPALSPCSGPRPVPGTGTQRWEPVGEPFRKQAWLLWRGGGGPRGAPRELGPGLDLGEQPLHRGELKRLESISPELLAKVSKSSGEVANSVLKETAATQSGNRPVSLGREPLNWISFQVQPYSKSQGVPLPAQFEVSSRAVQ